MLRAILALWYTLTVLVGPALCCCTVRAAGHGLPAAEGKAEARKPAKGCCCATKDGAACHDGRPQPVREQTPSNCPCKQHEKPDQDRPAPAASSGVEALSQSRLLDVPSTDAFAASLVSTALPAVGNALDPADTPARVAGRKLLAAYHILRC